MHGDGGGLSVRQHHILIHHTRANRGRFLFFFRFRFFFLERGGLGASWRVGWGCPRRRMHHRGGDERGREIFQRPRGNLSSSSSSFASPRRRGKQRCPPPSHSSVTRLGRLRPHRRKGQKRRCRWRSGEGRGPPLLLLLFGGRPQGVSHPRHLLHTRPFPRPHGALAAFQADFPTMSTGGEVRPPLSLHGMVFHPFGRPTTTPFFRLLSHSGDGGGGAIAATFFFPTLLPQMKVWLGEMRRRERNRGRVGMETLSVPTLPPLTFCGGVRRDIGKKSGLQRKWKRRSSSSSGVGATPQKRGAERLGSRKGGGRGEERRKHRSGQGDIVHRREQLLLLLLFVVFVVTSRVFGIPHRGKGKERIFRRCTSHGRRHRHGGEEKIVTRWRRRWRRRSVKRERPLHHLPLTIRVGRRALWSSTWGVEGEEVGPSSSSTCGKGGPHRGGGG